MNPGRPAGTTPERSRADLAPEQVEIRSAREEEFADIGALTAGVYVGEGHVHAESTYVAELLDTATRVRSALVLVASRAGAVLGSVTIARPGTPFADIARPGELEFRMLAVDPQARGGGIGAALVRAVIDTARAEGFDAVVLTTMPGMADARRMYDRIGFDHVPERDWATDSGLQLTVMRLAL
ncbi:GNAT family N-acetyltransferase [Nocardia sp. CA2R105]|uniref:GNAT family N-acetyltransferase n=1 Tax=Nocardia coffeae TaxID=2873381 RepID=UPI001CA7AE2A|nr:GNAT family N-acetyltransferase [Nocardia coffeae]MBY8856379.1 GNAT family N-acetyltransferase [Nocardia coffeae]